MYSNLFIYITWKPKTFIVTFKLTHNNVFFSNYLNRIKMIGINQKNVCLHLQAQLFKIDIQTETFLTRKTFVIIVHRWICLRTTWHALSLKCHFHYDSLFDHFRMAMGENYHADSSKLKISFITCVKQTQFAFIMPKVRFGSSEKRRNQIQIYL